MKKIFAIMCLAVVALFVLASCGVVESGTTGVKVVDGVVQDEVVPVGRYGALPARTTIKIVSNRRQLHNYDSTIYGESDDHTVVIAEGVSIVYRILEDESVWVVKNLPNYNDASLLIPDVKIASSVKNAMANISTDLVTNRSYIEPAAKIELQTAMDTLYKPNVIEIIDVSIKQMDYEESYNDAIARISELKKMQEEQELQNSITISKAAAEAEAARISAEGYAKAHIIEAEADVERMKMINEQLTENYIEYTKYQKWNGALPTHTNGTTYFSIEE